MVIVSSRGHTSNYDKNHRKHNDIPNKFLNMSEGETDKKSVGNPDENQKQLYHSEE